jgi:hypothetical protein
MLLMDQAVVTVQVADKDTVLNPPLLQRLPLQPQALLLIHRALKLQAERMAPQTASAKDASVALPMAKKQAIKMAIARAMRTANAMLAPKLTIKAFNVDLARAQYLALKKAAPTVIAMAPIAA